MINKQNIFASSGQQTQGYSASDYVGGMIPNTIAMAEDVNSFGNMLDTDVSSVCKEVANVVTNGVLDKDGGEGEALNAASFTQLLGALRAMSNGFVQTGIMYDGGSITCPTQSGVSSIVFGGQIRIMFNEGGYFGNSASKMQIGTIAANTSWTITNSEPIGARFLVATLSGGSVTLSSAASAPTGDAAADTCYLGSFFVVNNNGTKQIQADSWKFQPWLQNTPAIDRETPTAQTKGGLLTPSSGTSLNIGALDIKAEGINFDYSNHQQPNVKKLSAGAFSYKFLYPGYDLSASAATSLDTTHLYNLTAGSWDDISSQTGFVVMVPCVAPTGQTLMVPAMSTRDTGTGKYAAIFASVEDATNAVYSLQYTLDDPTNPQADRTRARAIYLGYSIIVKVGATDLTDPNNFAIVGMVPAALEGFTYAGGQTGGGVGQYVPMPTTTVDTNAFTAALNTKTIVTGRTAQVQITLPTPASGIVNQLEIEYTHVSGNGGVNFTNTVWWGGNQPEITEGVTYLFICEYVAGGWKTGFLTV